MQIPIRRPALRRLGALLVALAFLGGLPAAASAESRRRDDRHHRHDRHCGHDHKDRRGDYRDRRHGRHDDHHRFDRHRYRRQARHDDHRDRRHAYWCDACRRGFHGRSDFHRHVHYDHRVPLASFPFVIFQTTFGWAFHG